MVVAQSVRIKQLNAFLTALLQTVGISLMITAGTILGVDEGASYINIKTEGYATSGSGQDPKIYDYLDLRVPQIENGAIFISTYIKDSPVQTRYKDSTLQVARVCPGFDFHTEKCDFGSLDQCQLQFTKNGRVILPNCDPGGYCIINGWCNRYKYVCQTTLKAFETENDCYQDCPRCYPTSHRDNYCRGKCGFFPYLDKDSDERFEYKPKVCEMRRSSVQIPYLENYIEDSKQGVNNKTKKTFIFKSVVDCEHPEFYIDNGEIFYDYVKKDNTLGIIHEYNVTEKVDSNETHIIYNEPKECFNKYFVQSTNNEQTDLKCVKNAFYINKNLRHDKYNFVMDGIDTWNITFDVYLRFPNYYSNRNILNKRYKGVNFWNMSKILDMVGTNYINIRKTGIIILLHCNMDCSLLSTQCNINWEVLRLDTINKPGFQITHRNYVPPQTLYLKQISSMESRFVSDLVGIRIITSLNAKMYAPDPLAILVAIGSLSGLIGLSKVICDFLMKKEDYTYEQLIKNEKKQIDQAFKKVISEEMQILYEMEQTMKKILGADDDD